MENMWVWNDDETHEYTLKSMYKKLQGCIREEDPKLFELLWKLNVIPSMQHFARRVLLNKVATLENLINICVIVGNTMCVASTKIISHVFFGCKIVGKV